MGAFTLVLVGALNWGLIGLLGDSGNLVGMIFGFNEAFVKLVYILVGASAVWLVMTHKKDCMVCKKM